MRMSREKRNAIARLRRAIRPLLYPTGIVDEAQPDGKMRLYLFQHAPGGNRARGSEECHPFNDPGNGVVRTINDRYRNGRWAGSEIIYYHGFYDGGIVDDICLGITLHPFSELSLATLRSMEKLVARIRTYRKEGDRWVSSTTPTGPEKSWRPGRTPGDTWRPSSTRSTKATS